MVHREVSKTIYSLANTPPRSHRRRREYDIAFTYLYHRKYLPAVYCPPSELNLRKLTVGTSSLGSLYFDSHVDSALIYECFFGCNARGR